MRNARRVSPSENKSENEWPASATIAAERPATPANSLKKARNRLTRAPIQVIRVPPSENSAFFIDLRISACRSSVAPKIIGWRRIGRRTDV